MLHASEWEFRNYTTPTHQHLRQYEHSFELVSIDFLRIGKVDCCACHSCQGALLQNQISNKHGCFTLIFDAGYWPTQSFVFFFCVVVLIESDVKLKGSQDYNSSPPELTEEPQCYKAGSSTVRTTSSVCLNLLHCLEFKHTADSQQGVHPRPHHNLLQYNCTMKYHNYNK